MSGERSREIVHLDQRGRAYLSKLGFDGGATLVAAPVEGDESAWIIRPGKVITDVEMALLANASNVESLSRAVEESLRGDSGSDMI